jgi:transglutaminase-like putative cysteine protease
MTLTILAILAGLFTAHLDSLPSKEVPIYSQLTHSKEIVIDEDFGYTLKTQKTVTVFSPEGLPHASVGIFYDKLVQIKNFSLEIIDPQNGKTIQKAKMKDLSDAELFDGFSVFADNRQKYYQVNSSTFPIEVHIETEVYHQSNFSFQPWIPVERAFQKLEEAELKISYPESIGIRYKEQHLSGNRQEETLPDGRVQLTWKESELPVQDLSIKEEDDHRLYIAPKEFKLDNFRGSMTDWSELGLWKYKLNEGRDILPEEFKAKILELVEGIEDPYEKIAVLYDYLQKNFRYVSIQLGIGGWQTMTATDAVKYSYGDCKGLSNLMKAMLETAGIPAYYTLVYAGEGESDIHTDLPSNQFNHVILRAEVDEQPVWLECTSNSLPAGYLGSFTNDRHVLVVTPTGGYLAKTPGYQEDHWNRVENEFHISLDDRGDAQMTMKQHLEGNPAYTATSLSRQLDSRQQRDYFNKYSAISGLIIQDYELKPDHLDSLPIADREVKGIIQKFAQTTAKRLLLKPFFTKIKLEEIGFKNFDLSESYTIDLPSGVGSEFSLMPLEIKEEEYSILIENRLENNQLIVSRKIKVSLSDSQDEEAKKLIVSKINSVGNGAYHFTKPSLSQQ